MRKVTSSSPLGEDAFRLLAFMRAYADDCDQHLDPSWIQEQLEFTLDQLRLAARSLASRGLVEFFEWRTDDPAHWPMQIPDGLVPKDLRMTRAGWDYLRR